MDLREGGSHRIVMQMRDGQNYPIFEAVHDVAPDRCSVPVELFRTPTSGSRSFGQRARRSKT
jgi:hypothetical protein